MIEAAWEWLVGAARAVLLSVDAVWARDVITAALFLGVTLWVGHVYVARLQHKWATERKRVEVQSALQIETYLSMRRLSTDLAVHAGTFAAIAQRAAAIEGGPNAEELRGSVFKERDELQKEIGKTMKEMIEANARQSLAYTADEEARRLFSESIGTLLRSAMVALDERSDLVKSAADKLLELAGLLLKASDYGPGAPGNG